MATTRSITAPLLTLALGLLAVLSGCVLHWPDAPYLDSVEEVTPDAARQLEASHPGARPVTPEYRLHHESRSGRYRIVSRWILFRDSRSALHRGEIDESGRLRVRRARRIEALPDELRRTVFEGEHSVARGGRLSSPAWSYRDDRTGERLYEFEFEVGGRRGFGRIGESGGQMSARLLRPAD